MRSMVSDMSLDLCDNISFPCSIVSLRMKCHACTSIYVCVNVGVCMNCNRFGGNSVKIYRKSLSWVIPPN